MIALSIILGAVGGSLLFIGATGGIMTIAEVKRTNRRNKRVVEQDKPGKILRNLRALLELKDISYKGQIYNLVMITSAHEGEIDITLSDELGFTKTVSLSEVQINEKSGGGNG